MTEAVPHTVLYIGLQDHGWDKQGMFVDTGVCDNAVFHFIFKPEFFKGEIGRKEFDLFGQGDKRKGRILQGSPNELGKTADIFIGGENVLSEYILLDGIKAIEDEMRIHLSLECPVFQLEHLLIELVFFFLPAIDGSDTEGYRQPDQA